ncbi:MAG: septum site-determining protein MinC [Acetobacteraceae bacterium]|jgi:septum site-determining protein MinC
MTETRPFIRLRGRSIMALVLTPESPLPGWLAALDAQIERAPNFFDGRPVIVDVGPLPRETPNVAGLMHEIAARGIHIIGLEGAHPSWPGLEPWGRQLPGAGKPGKPVEIPEAAPHYAPPPQAAPEPPPTQSAPTRTEPAQSEPPSLLVDHSVRSGQSIAFESGDITVIGSVASGAEVVAGGSIHVYGALRGRAIAGLSGGAGARIYCSKLHAELVAIDGVYQTAEDMPPERIGGPSCAWLDGDQMRITPID